MKKQIISTVAAVALAASLAMPAAAVWQPSRVQQSGTGTAASAPSGTTGTELEVLNEAPTGTDGKAINVETSQNPWIKVTAVADTLAANEKFGADLSFSQKAGELTETGLFYSTNADTNLIYAAMDKAESTEAFLKLFGEDALAKVQADIGEGEDLNDYEAAAMFDVTASEGAKKLLNGKAVDVEVALPGVKADSKLIGLHFTNGPEDPEAAQETVKNDFANAKLEYDVEVINTVAGDGKATITMDSFSPVMILVKTEKTAAAAEATAAPTEEPAATEAPAAPADNGGSNWVLPAVIAVVVVAVGAVVVTRSKKKTTAGKK